MTRVLSADELDTHIEEILTTLKEGRDEIIVTRNNIAIARITPTQDAPADVKTGDAHPVYPLPNKGYGMDEGKIIIHDSFYEPMSEEELKEWGN